MGTTSDEGSRANTAQLYHIGGNYYKTKLKVKRAKTYVQHAAEWLFDFFRVFMFEGPILE